MPGLSRFQDSRITGDDPIRLISRSRLVNGRDGEFRVGIVWLLAILAFFFSIPFSGPATARPESLTIKATFRTPLATNVFLAYSLKLLVQRLEFFTAQRTVAILVEFLEHFLEIKWWASLRPAGSTLLTEPFFGSTGSTLLTEPFFGSTGSTSLTEPFFGSTGSTLLTEPFFGSTGSTSLTEPFFGSAGPSVWESFGAVAATFTH
jgi:hypothetical protein